MKYNPRTTRNDNIILPSIVTIMKQIAKIFWEICIYPFNHPFNFQTRRPFSGRPTALFPVGPGMGAGGIWRGQSKQV